MVKQTAGHPQHEILLIDEKKWTFDTHNSLGGSQGYYSEWKKIDSLKGFITNDSISYNILKMAKL